MRSDRLAGRLKCSPRGTAGQDRQWLTAEIAEQSGFHCVFPALGRMPEGHRSQEKARIGWPVHRLTQVCPL